ncbi:MAG: helix-turn-helix domain-containing protein [Lachnospiraceae bacterium]|nr:helix-turn-helix domain-containing protein [Lachnospiraceae bacterium]
MVARDSLEDIFYDIKGLSECELFLYDIDGGRIAGTKDLIVNIKDEVADFIRSGSDTREINGIRCTKVIEDEKPGYLLLVEGKAAELTSKLTANQLENLQTVFKEKIDKEGFIRDILLDNLLLIDIAAGSVKLKIKNEISRCVFIIDGVSEKETDRIFRMSDKAADDLVCIIEEGRDVYVAAIDEAEDEQEIEEKKKSIALNLQKCLDKNSKARIGYGSTEEVLRDLSRSYKEANIAIEVGKIFFDNIKILSYKNLGLGRLIYQLPMPFCTMFIEEIFDNVTPEEFDEETIDTINRFFENSLNVSETARQLFIHRNTLVYRLDKIQKITGLDLRVFEDAITFKIAMMVIRYMKYVEEEAF